MALRLTKKAHIIIIMRRLTKKKENRGGARPGAGAKKKAVTKEPVTFTLYPADKARIIEQYGSLQKWADKHIPKVALL